MWLPQNSTVATRLSQPNKHKTAPVGKVYFLYFLSLLARELRLRLLPQAHSYEIFLTDQRHNICGIRTEKGAISDGEKKCELLYDCL